MQLPRIFSIFAVCLIALLSACAVNNATATRISELDVSKVRTIYLVEHPDDKYKVNDIIKNNLVQRGFAVTTGPEKPPPYATDAVVRYVDKWMWDISMYMIELTVTVRNPNDFPALSGNSLHTSLTRKSPEAMVQEVLDNIFKTK